MIRDALRKPGLRQFLVRLGIYCACFILISLPIGKVIPGGPLLYQLGFFVYGGMGYIALAMSLFFIVSQRGRLIAVAPATPGHWLGYLGAAASTFSFYIIGGFLNRSPALAMANPLGWGVLLHSLFILIFITLLFGTFNICFIRRFVRDFKKELLLCLGIGVTFYLAMRITWLAWPYLSRGVSWLVYQLLQIAPGQATWIPPQTLAAHEFAVVIGEACSGVFSIFVFSILYALLLAMDWNILNRVRAVWLFFICVIGLYFVNVLRVYLIFLVGVYYNAELAVNLFHSFIGTLLFMLYFIAFLYGASNSLRR